MYPVGQIKLTWINPANYSILESRFFTSIPEAVAAAQGTENWLIFQLVETNGTYYKWQLLPYGAQAQYIRGMKTQRYVGLIMAGVIIALGLLFYSGYVIGRRNAT